MALSYSLVLNVPKSYTITTLDQGNFFEYNSGAGSGYTSIVQVLTDIKASHEGLFGGTFSWVITEDATHDIYTVTWDGLATDPESNPSYGNPVSIYIYNFDGGLQVSAQFTYAAICPCPPSVDPADAEDCLSCYDIEMDFCDASFDVDGLEASESYTIIVSDNLSGKSYEYPVTADAFGTCEIITADFPSGAFTPFNSPLTLSVLDSNGDPVVLTYGYVNYSCISLTVLNVSTIS
jgi:hypothetical protein